MSSKPQQFNAQQMEETSTYILIKDTFDYHVWGQNTQSRE
jgi:hypothetical protein